MKSPLPSRAKALFFDLEELDPAARAKRLEECEDPELAQAVRELFEAAAGTGSFLDGLPALPVPEPPVATADRSGVRIGAYLLEHLLGRGGMGEVWSARRADGEFQQAVAIKLLTAGVHRQDALARFQAERGILAQLAHPGIAALYDGGATEDGIPYFVMERIDGLAIDEYCDREALSVDERLELFLQVCRALEHAHEAGIVHRDIKPANVLVNRAGQVKLLDFGIAKVLGQQDWVKGIETVTGQTPMTPTYASPEQLRAERITPASDVYSLGVLLYELLTGMLPYDAEPESQIALALAICEGAVPRPGERFTTRLGEPSIHVEATAIARRDSVSGVHRRLKGDMDLITLMALRKEPQRRYRDASEVAADVRRHLDHYPIHAREESRLYRASRFVKRHQTSVGVALIGAMAVGGVGVLALKLASDKSTQSETIAAGRHQLSGLHDVLVQLYEEADPWSPQVMQATRRNLDVAVRPLREQPIENRSERARLHHAAGRAYLRLEQYNDAQELLEVAVEDLRELHVEPAPELVASLADLGVALAASPQGDPIRGRALLEEALTMGVSLHGPDALLVGRVHYALGVTAHNVSNPGRSGDPGDPGDPSGAFKEAIRIFELRGEQAPVEELVRALLRKGELLAVHHDFDEAIEALSEAMVMCRKEYGDEHVSIAMTADRLGLLLYRVGKEEEGIEHLKEGLEVNRRLFGEEGHSNLAWSLLNLGGAMAHVGDPAGAPLLEEAVELFRDLPSTQPSLLVFALDTLGKGLLALGVDGAVEAYAEAMDLGHGSGSVAELAGRRGHLIDALVSEEQFDRAIKLQRVTCAAWEKSAGPESEQALAAAQRLAEILALRD